MFLVDSVLYSGEDRNVGAIEEHVGAEGHLFQIGAEGRRSQSREGQCADGGKHESPRAIGANS